MLVISYSLNITAFWRHDMPEEHNGPGRPIESGKEHLHFPGGP